MDSDEPNKLERVYNYKEQLINEAEFFTNFSLGICEQVALNICNILREENVSNEVLINVLPKIKKECKTIGKAYDEWNENS